ncbi:MAG: NAD-dependent epimerase/dehydratase family protein [Desulfobacteraceae bacterium]
MNILITGGTGFIGRHLMRALIRQGFHCKCLTRGGSRVKNIAKLDNVTIVYGDITDKGSLQECMQGVEVVYHLAGQVGEWGVSDERFFAVNVEGTRNLLEAASEAGVKHFIFCSTPGVQGKGHANASEELPYNPSQIYELTKAEAEKIVLAFNSEKAEALKVTIVRPDFVYGPGDLRRIPLYRVSKNRRFFLIGDGMALFHPTFIDDAVQAFCLLPNNPVSFGQIYNIAGPQTMTVKEYVQTIAEALNVPLPRVKIPIAVGRVLALFFEAASRINGKAPVLSLSKMDFLTKHHGSDISKAMAQLGYKPESDFAKGISITFQWYRKENLL